MIIHLFCLILLLTPTLIQAAPPRPNSITAPPPAGARSDTLFLFAAEGPGSFGSPGTDARGFTFDGPGGEAANAGWLGVDLNAQELHWQLAGTDLCAGTGTDMSEALPFDPEDIVNDHALWCGSLDNCNWVDPDGYGNGWDQYVVLDLGPQSSATVIVSFSYSTDFEGGEYDYLELLSFVYDDWERQWYDNSEGDRTYREVEVAIPAAEIDPDSLRLAFRFHSDGAWSDQDGLFLSDLGAIWLDNIRVRVGEHEIFAADFEDGLLPQEMYFYLPESAGDYAKLYEGLYQGEADPVNESFVWAFFDSLTPSYDAPGYEFGIVWGPPYLNNAIESPRLSVDADGQPLSLGPATRVLLSADFYLDLSVGDLVFHAWHIGAVMASSGDCDPVFQNDNTVYYGEERYWISVTRDVTEELRQSAREAFWDVEAIVAQLAVVDMYGVWGGSWIEERNQAPYFDNVRVMLVEGELTAVPMTAPARIAITAHPNPFNPTTEICFTLHEAAEVELRVFDISGRLLRILLPVRTLEAGPHTVTWGGQDEADHSLPSGVYFARLTAGQFSAESKLVLLK